MQRLEKMALAQVKAKYDKGVVVLFFTADWCPDCRFIKPAMPEIEAKFADFKFLLVDRDENLDLARELNVFGIPSFVVFKDGKQVADLINKDRKTPDEVISFLNKIK